MVYFVTDGQKIKIGNSKNVKKRVLQLQVANSKELVLLGYVQGDEEKEKYLHKVFNQYRIRANGEWFEPAQELLDYINTNNEKENTMVEWIDGKLYPCLTIKAK